MASVSENPDGTIDIEITKQEFLDAAQAEAEAVAEAFKDPMCAALFSSLGLDPVDMVDFAQSKLDEIDSARKTLLTDEG